MITDEEIRAFLADLESDRVERTASTTNTDKFGQAICSFANDLPNHRMPGYLIIGANDDGTPACLKVTDEMLKNIASIKYDGNIQPQPSMSVEKIVMDGHDLIVAEVLPAPFPPVKYKGRVWVRTGPRRGIASESDEKILIEKRIANIHTHDAMPCMGTSMDDLDEEAIETYLRKAVPSDVLETDVRDIRLKLQSFGFYDTRFNLPTYAGVIMFGKNVERIMPGAYVQYVRFGGTSRSSNVASEYKFTGNLMKILAQLDTFVDTTITNRRPIPVSALREEIVVDYPHWATRELLMNAVCHRDYQSNGPIQFYQYSDRIEILNHGGLYGRVTPDNFPTVNDYRNPILAEAMKVLGFANRLSRGVERVETELLANGNGKPIFSLHLGTAFLVQENISATAQQKEIEAIAKGLIKESNGGNNGGNDGGNGGNGTYPQLSVRQAKIMHIIQLEPTITAKQMAVMAVISLRTLQRELALLQRLGLIKREGNLRNGSWQVCTRNTPQKNEVSKSQQHQ